MLKLTISNVDKNTAEIITYIAKKAGGKVKNADEKKLKDKAEFVDENITEFKEEMRKIKNKIVKNHNAISKNKISKVF